MAWVTQGYVENLIGTSAVTALGLSTAGIFAQFEGSARATVVSVIQYAGYASPGATVDTSTDAGAFLADLVAWLLVRSAYQGRKGVKLPESVSASIGEAQSKLDAVYNKKLPIPGMTPDTLGGYGGSTGSPTVGTGARPSAFSVSKLSGF